MIQEPYDMLPGNIVNLSAHLNIIGDSSGEDDDERFDEHGDQNDVPTSSFHYFPIQIAELKNEHQCCLMLM